MHQSLRDPVSHIRLELMTNGNMPRLSRTRKIFRNINPETGDTQYHRPRTDGITAPGMAASDF